MQGGRIVMQGDRIVMQGGRIVTARKHWGLKVFCKFSNSGQKGVSRVNRFTWHTSFRWIWHVPKHCVLKGFPRVLGGVARGSHSYARGLHSYARGSHSYGAKTLCFKDFLQVFQ